MSEPSDEQAFLAAYDSSEYPKPSVTVDLVIFTVIDTDLKLLLIRRARPPCQGELALPGGFVDVGPTAEDQGESLDEAASRELQEETNLPVGASYLEQLYTFGKPGRDPRMRVITVAYYALIRPDLARLVEAGDDAAEADWFSVSELGLNGPGGEDFAFDHAEIIDTALKRIRGKLNYSPIAFRLVPKTFTMAELRSVHEAIKGTTYDASNFRRRFRRMLTDGVILRAPGKRSQGRGRPAQVYRFDLDRAELWYG